MEVAEAQREMRVVYLAGSVGQAVSAVVWLTSAACATWSSARLGILVLVGGGALIFPLTQLALLALGRRASLAPDNPLRGLAQQIAFTVPLNLLVAAGATLYRLSWFYPACMIVVGSHYLPFVFLYGMVEYALLGALLVAGGVVLGFSAPRPFSLGGWCTGIVLLLFALVVRRLRRRDPTA